MSCSAAIFYRSLGPFHLFSEAVSELLMVTFGSTVSRKYFFRLSYFTSLLFVHFFSASQECFFPPSLLFSCSQIYPCFLLPLMVLESQLGQFFQVPGSREIHSCFPPIFNVFVTCKFVFLFKTVSTGPS